LSEEEEVDRRPEAQKGELVRGTDRELRSKGDRKGEGENV